MKEALIITNNPRVMEELGNVENVRFCADADQQEILRMARDLIHLGAKLIMHPMMGRIKPHETPYKSVFLEVETGDGVAAVGSGACTWGVNAAIGSGAGTRGVNAVGSGACTRGVNAVGSGAGVREAAGTVAEVGPLAAGQCGATDADSVLIIEESIAETRKLIENTSYKKYDDAMLPDLQYIDFLLLSAGLEEYRR